MKKLIAVIALMGSVAYAADVVMVDVQTLDDFGGDTSAVLTRCQTKEGMPYDPVTITRDVNSLKSSGEYESITADAKRQENGIAVTFVVKRKMRYQGPATVEGNDFFSESKVLREAGLKDGNLYGEADFAAAAAKVRMAYQKKDFNEVKVTPVVSIIPGGNHCHVKFVVDEGARYRINDYRFENTTAEVDELKTTIGVYPWWNPFGWFTDAPVTDEQLAQSVAKVKEYFADRGYLDVEVEGPKRVESEEEPGESDIVYSITEGPLYTIASMKIVGLTRYPEELVARESKLPEIGAVAGEKTLTDAAHRIMVQVGSGRFGLADSRVDVQRVPSEADENALDIIFKVTEGVPVVINQIVVEGNDYTKDKVIRREIKLNPGDPMVEDEAEMAQKRLENLDYFSRVRHYLRKTDLGKDENGREYRDLVYEVEEKNTGSFMVGIGASSVDSVYVSAEVSQSNFDLFAPGKLFRGGGQKARVYAAAGPRIQSYEASINEPHLFDRLLDFTVEVYRRNRWYDDYDIIRTGGALTLSYPVKFWKTWEPFGRFGIRWSGEFIEFDDITKGEYEFQGKTVSLEEEERKYGDAFESVFRLFWSHDSRDSFRMPTRGHRTNLFVDLAYGGDNEYWKAGFNHRSYFTTWRKYGHVLMIGLRAETIDAISDEVPIYNRLFMGGPKSIRGIEYRNVSPMARRESNNDYTPWGGRTLACMNIEYTVPIVKMLRVAAFTDLGSVGVDEFDFDFGDTFAWTVGFGVRLDLPMFPIRLDFATPIKTPDHAEEEVFSFSVGYDF